MEKIKIENIEYNLNLDELNFASLMCYSKLAGKDLDTNDLNLMFYRIYYIYSLLFGNNPDTFNYSIDEFIILLNKNKDIYKELIEILSNSDKKKDGTLTEINPTTETI